MDIRKYLSMLLYSFLTFSPNSWEFLVQILHDIINLMRHIVLQTTGQQYEKNSPKSGSVSGQIWVAKSDHVQIRPDLYLVQPYIMHTANNHSLKVDFTLKSDIIFPSVIVHYHYATHFHHII